MTIVDTHCHAGRSWFEPIEMLLNQMNANGVDKAVLIQHGGTYDNSYLFECARRFEGRFAVVVIVDSSRDDAPAMLEHWANEGAVGVRLAPLMRSPGDDPLAVWRKASELGLLVSSLGNVEGFASAEFESVVAEFPDMPIIIEHLAGVRIGAEPPFSDFKKAIALAKYPNTYIKVGGLGERSERPATLEPDFKFDHTPLLIEMVINSFGPRRMMWGSDYPPVSGREGYRNALEGIAQHPALKNPDDRNWVMGRTAQELFTWIS
jgi:L-fuconolactonase